MHLFKEKAEAEAKIESIIELLNLKEEPNSLDKYKIIFAKSFFNVVKKPITKEDEELYRELNKLGGDKITPVGELDYSQAKIPNTQEEYSQAYDRARNAIREELSTKIKNGQALSDDKITELTKKISTSSINLIKESEPSLVQFNNSSIIHQASNSNTTRLENKVKEVNELAKTLERGVSKLSDPSVLVKVKTLGINNDLETVLQKAKSSLQEAKELTNQKASQTQLSSRRVITPSPSPREPKASCLSGMFKAIANFRAPNFSSIYHKLRSGSGGSKGGQGR